MIVQYRYNSSSVSFTRVETAGSGDVRKKQWNLSADDGRKHEVAASAELSVNLATLLHQTLRKMARNPSLRRATPILFIFLISLFVLGAFAPLPSISHHSSQFHLDNVSYLIL